MSDAFRLPFALPLVETWVVEAWRGRRAYFRDGWTGLASDRLRVYHLPAADSHDATEGIEVTTYVDGRWLGADHVELELMRRPSAAGPAPKGQTVVLQLDGQPVPFWVAHRSDAWAGLSQGIDPVVTILAHRVVPEGLSLVRVPADAVDGYERFDT